MNRTFEIKPAERESAPLLAAITGMSGMGKTYSALLLARGVAGPDGNIVLIDTEGRRGKWYADDPEIGGYNHMEFNPPYDPDSFISAINAAIGAGADVVIIDSISHVWEGEGGVLSFAEAEEARMANNPRRNQSKWVKPKIAHGRLMSTIRSCQTHLIMCVREKSIIDVDQYDDVKKQKGKEIFIPVCERNFMYDMTLALRVVGKGVCNYIKVPKFFEGHVEDNTQISARHGALLLSECSAGKSIEDLEQMKRAAIANLEQVARERGTDELKHWWTKMLTKEQRDVVGTKELDRIKLIAKDTDVINFEEELSEETTSFS